MSKAPYRNGKPETCACGRPGVAKIGNDPICAVCQAIALRNQPSARPRRLRRMFRLSSGIEEYRMPTVRGWWST